MVSTARTNLGATVVGSNLFTAVNAGAGRAALSSTTVGDVPFITASDGVALAMLGDGSTGDAVFTARDRISGRLALGATVMGDYTSFMIGGYEVTFARVRQGYVAVQCKRCLVICEKARAEEGAIERWNAGLLKTIKTTMLTKVRGQNTIIYSLIH